MCCPIYQIINCGRHLFEEINWEALTAIGTLLAVVVALFQPTLSRRWREPKLALNLRKRDADYDYEPSTKDGAVRLHGTVRLLVQNYGRSAAESMRLTVSDIYRESAPDKYELMTAFIQTGLKWTHLDTATLDVLPAGTSVLGDFGDLTIDEKSGSQRVFRFTLYTQIQPKSGYNVLDTGSYIGRVVISGTNFKALVQLIAFRVGEQTTGNFFSVRIANTKQRRLIAAVDQSHLASG